MLMLEQKESSKARPPIAPRPNAGGSKSKEIEADTHAKAAGGEGGGPYTNRDDALYGKLIAHVQAVL